MNKRGVALIIVMFLGVFNLLGRAKKIKSVSTSKTEVLKEDVSVGDGEAEVKKLFQHAHDTARVLEDEVSERIAEMRKDASSVMKKLRDDIEVKAKKLREKADLRAQVVKLDAEQETKKLFADTARRAAEVNDKIEREAFKLKREASAKIARLVDNAEREAFTIRRNMRQKGWHDDFKHVYVSLPKVQIPDAQEHAQDVKSGVSKEWKQSIGMQVAKDAALMKSIIIEGEDESHVHDFMQRFNNQRQWLDQTLSSTRYAGDLHYRQIVTKQVQLHSIVLAQQKADDLLRDLLSMGKCVPADFKKARLMALYDVSVLVQQRAPTTAITVVSDQEIKDIVQNVIQEVLGKKEVVVRSAQEEISVLSDKLSQKRVLNVQLRDRARMCLENIGAENMRTEIQLKTMTQRLDWYKLELTRLKDTLTHEMGSKNKLIHLFEGQGKELFEQSMFVRKVQEELERKKQDFNNLTTSFAKEKEQAVLSAQKQLRQDFSKKLEAQAHSYLSDCLDIKYQLTGAHQQALRLERNSQVLSRELTDTRAKLAQVERDTVKTVSLLDEQLRTTKTLADKMGRISVGHDVEFTHIKERAAYLLREALRELRHHKDLLTKHIDSAVEKVREEARTSREYITKELQELLTSKQYISKDSQQKIAEEKNRLDLEKELEIRLAQK
jgi:hypothetical protein